MHFFKSVTPNGPESSFVEPRGTNQKFSASPVENGGIDEGLNVAAATLDEVHTDDSPVQDGRGGVVAYNDSVVRD